MADERLNDTLKDEIAALHRDLSELRSAFVLFRRNAINEMARFQVEVGAVYRAASESNKTPLNEKHLDNFRLLLAPMQGSYADEISQRLGLPLEPYTCT